jgi:spoIIIJ-associated protein
MDNLTLILKETTEEILKMMGFEGEVKIDSDRDGTPLVSVYAPEGGALIGQGGANLAALQHLIRLMVARKTHTEDAFETKRFVLDINCYRKDRADVLKDFIMDKADEAIRSRRTISLFPMSSYERRIAHLAFKDNPNILCQSEGEGEERHIVIKPLV